MSIVRYAANLSPQADGGFSVAFPAIPEAITEGDDRAAALYNAGEALTLALEQRIIDGDPLPPAGKLGKGVWVEPSASVQAAALVRMAREAEGKTLADLARALNTSWPSAQRLEQPRSNPTLRQLERAAASLGKRLVVELV